MVQYFQDEYIPHSLQESFFQTLRPGQMMESLFDCVPGAFFFVRLKSFHICSNVKFLALGFVFVFLSIVSMNKPGLFPKQSLD